MITDNLAALVREIEILHQRHESAGMMTPDYYEPGLMEYPGQSDGSYDEKTGKIVLCFEAKGTRYEERTEIIEQVKVGDSILVRRDPQNQYNSNNFRLYTTDNRDVGNLPANLCNALAPLYDAGMLVIDSAEASYVEPVTQRSRHAKQAILFVEIKATLSE